LKDGVLDGIRMVCRAADRRLWEAYDRSISRDFTGSPSSKLVFPTYERGRVGVLRVSEQEARFALAESLADAAAFYSVETPTQEGYQQTGSKPLSAQTDLTLYDRTGVRMCNVEFKAKGASSDAKSHINIRKDLEKLLREPELGLWFHLLEGADNSTIPSLLNVIASEMQVVYDEHPGSVAAPRLIIHICVLRQGLSLDRNVILTRDRAPAVSLIWDSSRTSLGFSRGELLDWRGLGEGDLHRRRQGPPAN
jgi:hypothetical protein